MARGLVRDRNSISRGLARKFRRDVSILFRPEDVAHRTQFGQWEGNLVLFRQKSGRADVASLVDRVSRFIVLQRRAPFVSWAR